MVLNLKRQAVTSKTTSGTLCYAGNFVCFTLEPTPLKIPAGTYKVVLEQSPHFHEITPHLLNVSGRDHIEIHPGNESCDSHGCILVGANRAPDEVLHSQDAFTHLMKLIQNDPNLIIVVVD